MDRFCKTQVVVCLIRTTQICKGRFVRQHLLQHEVYSSAAVDESNQKHGLAYKASQPSFVQVHVISPGSDEATKASEVFITFTRYHCLQAVRDQ